MSDLHSLVTLSKSLAGAVTGRMPGLSPDGLEAHLHAAVAWMLRAQAASGDGGMSAYFDLLRGRWVASYPETTGYAISTLLAYAARFGREDVRDAALRMAEYELTVQLPDGSFPGLSLAPKAAPRGVAFDTGQVLFGLLAAHDETGDSRFFDAAIQAGNWLVTSQSADGTWADYHGKGSVRAIDTRVAWPLLLLHGKTADSRYLETARKQLDWVLSQQHSNGWYDNCTFEPGKAPVTHTIAYVIEGLLESGLLLSEERYVESARRAADVLRNRVQPSGRLAGAFDNQWRATVSWSCLTGSAQLAHIWRRLADLTGEPSYGKVAAQAIGFVCTTQALASTAQATQGAIAGSWPIYGGYLRLKYPNWAAKFVVDALL